MPTRRCPTTQSTRRARPASHARARRALTLGAVGCALGGLAVACTDADLYTSGAAVLPPDKLLVEGEICTADTGGQNFPVKVLNVLDGSVEMFRADPDGFRFCGEGSECAFGSLQGTLERHSSDPHVGFGFVATGLTSTAVPADQPQRFWRPQEPEVQQAFVALQNPRGNRRDLTDALARVESFIASDVARSAPGELLRSRYLVSMLFAGPPDGTDAANAPERASQLAQQVADLRARVQDWGVLEFRLNIGLLYYGPRRLQGAENSYGCHGPGGANAAPCTCDTTVEGSAAYCSVYCDVDSGAATEAQMEAARQVYQAMANAGGGRFHEFECPASIDLSTGVGSSPVRLAKKEIVAFNRNSVLTARGPAPDSDGDGLADFEEEAANPPTDPLRRDTDGDGLGDAFEFRAAPKQDPRDGSDRPTTCRQLTDSVGPVDRDLDLLYDCEESLLQTNPTVPDTDGDGLSDFLEAMSSTVPTADDRLLDYDGDGVNNAAEVAAHTNPRAHDGRRQGAESYRTRISSLGFRSVGSMADPETLPGISFRSASSNVVGGPALLRWRPCELELAWSDARVNAVPAYTPEPVTVDGSGLYTLEATSPNGDTISVDVYVDVGGMPTCDDTDEVVATPLISISERHCYDVRITNIKLSQTRPLGPDAEAGHNEILLFFTQAPESRLSSPGIASTAAVPVRFVCEDAQRLETCQREPADGKIDISRAEWVSALP